MCRIPENINEEGYFNFERNNELVLDDMMTTCKDDDGVTKLFIVRSHHKNLSMIYLVQISSIRVKKPEILAYIPII